MMMIDVRKCNCFVTKGDTKLKLENKVNIVVNDLYHTKQAKKYYYLFLAPEAKTTGCYMFVVSECLSLRVCIRLWFRNSRMDYSFL